MERRLIDATTLDELAEGIGRVALGKGLVVAVAESLTGGALAVRLAKAADAAEWFAGGVVAYRNETKFRVLGVPEGPVVSAESARTMAIGVLGITGADVAVAVTGVGGPGSEEGEPAGAVYICAASRFATHEFAHVFPGDPDEVVSLTIEHALRHLTGVLIEADPRDASIGSPP